MNSEKRLKIAQNEASGQTKKTNLPKMLPKTADEIENGGLYLQHVKCGKKNCKCVSGKRHSAHYFIQRIDGKLTKTHVPKFIVTEFSLLVEQSRERRVKERQNRLSARQIIRALKAMEKERWRNLLGRSKPTLADLLKYPDFFL